MPKKKMYAAARYTSIIWSVVNVVPIISTEFDEIISGIIKNS
jgi:hypothetical protein